MKEIELRRITRGEMADLWDKYFYPEGYAFSPNHHHSLDQQSSKVLYALLRKYQPQTCMEFGTYKGGSAAITVAALEKNGLPYTYTSFEINPDYRKEAAEHVLEQTGKTIIIHDDVTKNLDKIPDELDLAFIDPEWDKEIAVWTYRNIIPRVKKGGLVAIHDWSVTEELKYEGGSFPGINYFIQLFENNQMPLSKLFSMWDHEEFRPQLALSFWVKL